MSATKWPPPPEQQRRAHCRAPLRRFRHTGMAGTRAHCGRPHNGGAAMSLCGAPFPLAEGLGMGALRHAQAPAEISNRSLLERRAPDPNGRHSHLLPHRVFRR